MGKHGRKLPGNWGKKLAKKQAEMQGLGFIMQARTHACRSLLTNQPGRPMNDSPHLAALYAL